MSYAELQDVEAGFRVLSDEERSRCTALLSEAALIIDTYNADADADRKRLVSCRMVRRQLGEDDSGDAVTFPMGATQGTATALGYSQSWTMSGGSTGRTQPAGGLMLKGIDIILYEKTKTGEDGFHDPIYEESPVTVHNVLVGQPTAEEITTELQLTGRRIAYTLAIPKGDTHNWDNVRVAFFGQTFRTCGGAVQGIEAMIPLRWNKKVQVERYE